MSRWTSAMTPPARRGRRPIGSKSSRSGTRRVRIRAPAVADLGCLHARLAHQLWRVTHARGLLRRHLNPLLETGFSRPILFEDLPPLAAHDRADSVRQVPRVRV
jgi:hypothetical protein